MCRNCESLSPLSESWDGLRNLLKLHSKQQIVATVLYCLSKESKPYLKKKNATLSPQLLCRSPSTKARGARSHLLGARAFPGTQIHKRNLGDSQEGSELPPNMHPDSLASRMKAEPSQNRGKNESAATSSPLWGVNLQSGQGGCGLRDPIASQPGLSSSDLEPCAHSPSFLKNWLIPLPWEMRSDEGDSFCQILDLTGFQNTKLIFLVVSSFVTEVSKNSTGETTLVQASLNYGKIWATE